MALAYDQLLESDLRKTGNPYALPLDLSILHDVTLKGPYLVQFHEAINVNQSIQHQLEELETWKHKNKIVLNDEKENDEEDQRSESNINSGKKMLKILLHDGYQLVYAMEYEKLEPFKDYRWKECIGMKWIVEDVAVKHGIIVIRKDSVKILGGRIAELCTGYDLEKRLKELLTYGITQYAYQADSRIGTITQNNENSTTTSTSPTGTSTTLNSDTDGAPNEKRKSLSLPHNNTKTREVIDDASINEKFTDVRKQGPSTHMTKKLSNNFNGLVLNEATNNSYVKQDYLPEPKMKVKPTMKTSTKPVASLKKLLLDEDVPYFNKNKSPSRFREIIEIDDMEIIPATMMTDKACHGMSFDYLSNIIESGPSIEKVFKINAFLKTLTGKMQFESGRYSITGIIDDGSAALKTELGNEIIEELLGYDALEFRRNSESQEGKAKNAAAARFAKEKFKRMHGIMEIRWEDPTALPTVIRLKEPCETDACNLLLKIKSELS